MLYLGIAIVLLVLIGMLYLRVSRGGTTRAPASRGRNDGSYVTGAHTSTSDRHDSSSRDGNDDGSSGGADSTPSGSDGGGSSGGDGGGSSSN